MRGCGIELTWEEDIVVSVVTGSSGGSLWWVAGEIGATNVREMIFLISGLGKWFSAEN
ncbi:hypothetical protein NBRC116493_24040 [Aurantivibrio infirmus]